MQDLFHAHTFERYQSFFYFHGKIVEIHDFRKAPIVSLVAAEGLHLAIRQNLRPVDTMRRH